MAAHAGAIGTGRALVTGITGQDGSYLAQFLSTKGYTVFGVVRNLVSPASHAIRDLCPGVELLEADLLDQPSLLTAIETSRPSEVYNLGAISFAGGGVDTALATANVTALGVTRVLEAVRIVDPTIRFYQASSSEMFGDADVAPQNESTAFRPRSPYGIAKLYGHFVTAAYRAQQGMFTCCGILFNHESPRRGPQFVSRKIAIAVARIKLGLQKDLVLGDLDARRDWGYAGDYVETMYLMLQRAQPHDLVIATGVTHSVRDFCERAFATVGLDYREHVRVDPSLVRAPTRQVSVGDARKAFVDLGWRATVPFDQLVSMMVDSEMRRSTSR